MDFQKLSQRAVSIRAQYQNYEQINYGSAWSREEMALGFVGDVGDLAKLVMAANGRRNNPDAKEKLAHELADCLWSIIVLAESHGINLEQAFINTMDDIEAWIKAGEVVG
jgi:NTP pyrophosphatase (non-canonical NTP hydrolase)